MLNINNKTITFGWCTRKGDLQVPQTHRDLATISFNYVKDNKYIKANDEYYNLIKKNIAHVDDPDLEKKSVISVFSNHFINAQTGKNFLNSKDTSLSKLLDYSEQALNFYKKSKKNLADNPQKSKKQLIKSAISFENALHYIQDMGQPDHTTTKSFQDALKKVNRHVSFEIFAGENITSFNFNYNPDLVIKKLNNTIFKKNYKNFIKKTGLNIEKKSNLEKKISKIAYLMIETSSKQAKGIEDPIKWSQISEKTLKNTADLTATYITTFFKELIKYT